MGHPCGYWRTHDPLVPGRWRSAPRGHSLNSSASDDATNGGASNAGDANRDGANDASDANDPNRPAECWNLAARRHRRGGGWVRLPRVKTRLRQERQPRPRAEAFLSSGTYLYRLVTARRISSLCVDWMAVRPGRSDVRVSGVSVALRLPRRVRLLCGPLALFEPQEVTRFFLFDNKGKILTEHR